jgi:hypothetical protein
MNQFYILYKAAGPEGVEEPVWANSGSAGLENVGGDRQETMWVDVPGVDRAFEIKNVLSLRECRHLIETAEHLGFKLDAPTFADRKMRQNFSLPWIPDESTMSLIWDRIRGVVAVEFEGRRARGLSGRIRLYRYEPGQMFKRHIDFSHPGVRVIDGKAVEDEGRFGKGRLSLLIYLNDDFSGGETILYERKESGNEKNEDDLWDETRVHPSAGDALCFNQGWGNHPLVHEGAVVTEGTKYIIKSDIVY